MMGIQTENWTDAIWSTGKIVFLPVLVHPDCYNKHHRWGAYKHIDFSQFWRLEV